MLREYTMRRRLLSLSEKMHLAANDPTADVIDSIYLTQEKLSDLFASFKSGNITHISEYAEEVYVSYVKAVESGGKLFGIPTGFARLDNATGGLQGLIYLAARPSMGKTSLMLKIARNVAKSTGPVLVVSIETSGELLTKRTLSDIARVNGQHIQTGYGTSFDIEAVRSASIQTHDLPVYFYVTGSITEAELYGIVKQMKAEKNISLVAIDYVQLMRSSIKTNNREQEISYISRGLKIITQDLKVPVLALSQLSRQVESRGDKRPHLADLRDSGSLEQDADQVMFIMRPEYYGQNSFVAANGAELPTACLAVVDLAKNKDGSTGETLLKFEPEFTSFSDYVF
jgi:replicative DNA helicase